MSEFHLPYDYENSIVCFICWGDLRLESIGFNPGD